MVRSTRLERGKRKELYVLYTVVFNGKTITVTRCVINGWLIYIDSIFVYRNTSLLHSINFILVLIYFQILVTKCSKWWDDFHNLIIFVQYQGHATIFPVCKIRRQRRDYSSIIKWNSLTFWDSHHVQKSQHQFFLIINYASLFMMFTANSTFSLGRI